MTWVISLILLAVAAYFLISALSGKNQYDIDNQSGNGESDAEINQAESAQLSSDASSGDAFQNAGGAPTGAGSSDAATGSAGSSSNQATSSASSTSGSNTNASSSGSSVAAGAVGATTAVTAAAAIASAREHNLKNVAGNSVAEIQEMLKILNLRDSDSGRLAIDKDQYAALKGGTSNLGSNELTAVADKLRWMLR